MCLLPLLSLPKSCPSLHHHLHASQLLPQINTRHLPPPNFSIPPRCSQLWRAGNLLLSSLCLLPVIALLRMMFLQRRRVPEEGDAGLETNFVHQSSSSSSSLTSSCGRCSSFSPTPSAASAVGTPPPAAAAEGPCASPGQLAEEVDVRCSLVALPSRKPHRSSDPAWAAIRCLGRPIGPRDFKIIRRLGSGDIGTVYLCSLRDDPLYGTPPPASPSAYYAMKVVDRRELTKKKKLGRAEAERRVLAALDHPFLPTLYAGFDAPPHFSCAVMEFCSGGDLHTLRHRLPSKCFSLSAVRFYGAEVLLAMEYLHMLGIVYRDLKPENVLIRSDGHIMLSDFDLSLESTAFPAVRFSPDRYEPPSSSPFPASPSCSGEEDGNRSLPSCLPGRLFKLVNKFKLVKKSWKRTKGPTATMTRSRSTRSCSSTSTVFVAEPVEARSASFVGTHEYVAPEVAAGGAHGSAVDWWAYGVFLYEMAYGRTPFVGATNAATLRNVVRAPLAFPAHPPVDPRLRALISTLLEKDPSRRLGSTFGAAEVKAHPFFDGLNFALLRSQRPPVVPGAPHPARSKSCHEQRRGRVQPDRSSSFDLF